MAGGRTMPAHPCRGYPGCGICFITSTMNRRNALRRKKLGRGANVGGFFSIPAMSSYAMESSMMLDGTVVLSLTRTVDALKGETD